MNDGNNFRFDLWLYNEMVKRGWDYKTMGDKCGVHHSTIKTFIKNERNPSLRTFAAILNGLGKRIEIVDN